MKLTTLESDPRMGIFGIEGTVMTVTYHVKTVTINALTKQLLDQYITFPNLKIGDMASFNLYQYEGETDYILEGVSIIDHTNKTSFTTNINNLAIVISPKLFKLLDLPDNEATRILYA